MKKLTVNIDPERLQKDPELETQFLKLFGREQLNKVYAEDETFDFTQEEIGEMSESEFAQKRDKINEALAAGKVQ